MTIAADREGTVTIAGLRVTTSVALFGGSRSGRKEGLFHVAIATSRYGTIAIACLRISACVAFFICVRIVNAVAAELFAAAGAAAVSGYSIAIIASLSCCPIQYAVATHLVRCAVRAASVSIEHVAVITDLIFFYDAITAATDTDADSLIGGADLPGTAAQAGCFA